MDKKIAKATLEAATSTGADFAELYFQDKLSKLIRLDYRKVDNVSMGQTYGASVRIMLGTQQVFGYTSDVSEKALVALATKLAASFDGKRKLTIGEFKAIKGSKIHAPQKESDLMTTEQKIEYLKAGEAAAYEVSPLVVNVTAGLSETDERIEVYTVTEEGAKFVKDRRVRTRVMCYTVAGREGTFETSGISPGYSVGLELLDSVKFVDECKKGARLAVKLLDAPECPSGNMPVIIGNRFGGVLFHEACGHPLEGTAISHNRSPFAGKIGQKVASDVVTAIDDGTVEHGWGSSDFDDEGTPTTKNVLIENGILKSYMIDTFDGRRMNMKSTGACRRESYKYLPTTRMTNTYIAGGNSTVEEIIKSTKYGIYCVSFAGGSVDPTTDKFNFSSAETYLIKDGKIDKLVKCPTLTGYGYEILPRIDMVANDCELAAGVCGAASGSVPAAVGQATLRVSEMTVGGKGDTIEEA